MIRLFRFLGAVGIAAANDCAALVVPGSVALLLVLTSWVMTN
jgi:hypothetical protein